MLHAKGHTRLIELNDTFRYKTSQGFLNIETIYIHHGSKECCEGLYIDYRFEDNYLLNKCQDNFDKKEDDNRASFHSPSYKNHSAGLLHIDHYYD